MGNQSLVALTREEAAFTLGISKYSLDRLVARGLIRPCRALGRPLFGRKELERFIEENL